MADDSKLTVHVGVRMTEAEASALKQRAAHEARSVSNLARLILLKAIAAQGRPEQRA